MYVQGIERIVLLDFIHRLVSQDTRRWIKTISTIRSILTHHRQNPTEIIYVQGPGMSTVETWWAKQLEVPLTILSNVSNEVYCPCCWTSNRTRDVMPEENFELSGPILQLQGLCF